MNTALRGGFVAVALLIGVISGSRTMTAQSFSFPVGGFTSTNVCPNSGTPASSCQVLTNGSPNQPTLTTSGGLRLTTANTNQHGSAWFSVQQPLSTGFTTAFQFQISSTNSCYGCAFPADGMALVIQNDPAGAGALGYTGDGQNMSYGNNDVSTASGPGNAITNSLAIELDTFQNANYSDPNGNHIAVQSCGPNNASTLTPNSADHDYLCPDGNLAKLALQTLPSGLSLSDGNIHTITVNYLPPGTCTSSCNNLSVYVDSTLILQATLNIATQLNLTGNGSAYLGFTAATGSLVENNDIVSWSFSSLPLAPITINQPLQTTTTTFNYTPTLSAITDYSQSGLGTGAFSGVFMQGTVQTITDQQFSDLVNNTPFQGSSCQHQDTGSGNYACVVTTDLCTTSASGTPSGANCPNTGTNALINVSNTYNLDPSQKPIMAPGYIMGTDTALSCGANADNTCKGLVNIFTSISGDTATSGGRTNNFNSTLIPILGVIQPSTSATTSPVLNQGWTNGSVRLYFNSTEVRPSNNTNPPASLPTIATINYSAAGANPPSPPSGTISGISGSIAIPATAQGATVVTFFATDSAGTVESLTTNSGGQVSSATPTITIQVDTIPPTVSCIPPAPAWQATDVVVPCTASDNAGGSGLVGPASFKVTTSVPAGTETNAATIAAVTVQDVAGNTSAPQGPFGPFEVDKKAPAIMVPTISPASPFFGQSVTANYSCTDGGSGVVLCGPSGSQHISPTGSVSLSSSVSGSVGSHTFTVYAQDAVGNQSAPSSVTYTVGQATPVLNWSTPAAITYGTALSATQLTATASVVGAFTYTPAAGTVLTAGSHTLSVTFTPTDNTDYTTATATVLLVVKQAAPTISWATPAPITYGTALSALQLNAAASVAGTFVYNPAAGTVLNAGTQMLSATFTPTDSTDYSTAAATVPLVVNQAASVISWATPAPITYGTPLSSAQLDATANIPGTFVYAPPAGTVLPAGSQTLAVNFTPTNTLDYSSATTQVTLLVTQPSINLSPGSLNFGNVKYGNLVFLLETVSNPNSTPLKMTGVSIKLGSGSDSDDFGFLNLCGEYLNPGKSCDIVISFYADDLGTHNATLLVSDSAAGSPQQIPITANVVKK
ncbi:MAG: choice-of-anchor D domain-containing protein [Candidatus Sulfotelmatobacter sp.]